MADRPPWTTENPNPLWTAMDPDSIERRRFAVLLWVVFALGGDADLADKMADEMEAAVRAGANG